MKYSVKVHQTKTDEYEIEAESAEEARKFADDLWFENELGDNTEINVEVDEVREEKMKVVLLEPGKIAREAEIGTSLREMQNVVGGLIECAYFFNEDVCIVCNDEGKINGMPLNRGVYTDGQTLIDIIAGPAFICDCSGENFASLSKEQLERYQKMFKYPEHFVQMDGKILGVKYNPERGKDER